LQRINRWDDPAYRAQRDDLVSDLRDHQPVQQRPLRPLVAPV
jgi:hypothetical protein